jgi:hypothetical protein
MGICPFPGKTLLHAAYAIIKKEKISSVENLRIFLTLLGASNLIRDEMGEEPSGSSTHLVCFEELLRVLLILVVLMNRSDPAAAASPHCDDVVLPV